MSKTGEPLPAEYVPPDLVTLPPGAGVPAGLPLRRDAAEAFLQMQEAARRQGLRIVVVSGYRSYAEQQAIYNAEVRRIGRAEAERQVAIPGRSEHQLGTTADISTPRFSYELDDAFGRVSEGLWLAAHAAEYGFVLSYPEGKEQITGYRWEPWHLRYVGVNTALYIGLTGRTSTEVLSVFRDSGTDPPTIRPAAPVAQCSVRGLSEMAC